MTNSGNKRYRQFLRSRHYLFALEDSALACFGLEKRCSFSLIFCFCDLALGRVITVLGEGVMTAFEIAGFFKNIFICEHLALV
jgi:hypothetical protein